MPALEAEHPAVLAQTLTGAYAAGGEGGEGAASKPTQGSKKGNQQQADGAHSKNAAGSVNSAPLGPQHGAGQNSHGTGSHGGRGSQQPIPPSGVPGQPSPVRALIATTVY